MEMIQVVNKSLYAKYNVMVISFRLVSGKNSSGGYKQEKITKMEEVKICPSQNQERVQTTSITKQSK